MNALCRRCHRLYRVETGERYGGHAHPEAAIGTELCKVCREALNLDGGDRQAWEIPGEIER